MHVAIDLGAGSGRVVVGGLTDAGFRLREAHRFHYPPSRQAGHLRWPTRAIFEGIETGLAAAGAQARTVGRTLESVGVDSWGVDYGLVDGSGRLVEEPIAYRDERTAREMEAAFAIVPREEIFRRTGIQFLVFNTLYQLRAAAREGLPRAARRLLMIPDLCHHHLCGSTSGEYTDASTTQLLDALRKTWDHELVARLGLPVELLPDLQNPGAVLGTLRPELQRSLSLPALRVIAPATHDTGSAVAGTPLAPGWAYISSGTWSLVGVERPAPLIDAQVAEANFTNEGGAYGSIRFLKNVMGLWILESCRREWAEAGQAQDLDALLSGVAALEESRGLVFPDDPRFLNPVSMTAELQRALRESDQEAPTGPVGLARVVLDSLALRYASVLRSIERLTSSSLRGVRVVGGGSRNDYLNQATADASGLPVLAGPEEATATGNLLVQAITAGHAASLSEARDAVGRALPARAFEPRRSAAWHEAAGRYAEVERRYE